MFATKMGVIIILDIESKKVIKRIPITERTERIEELYFAPDGENIVICCFDDRIIVWNIPSEKSIFNKDLKNFEINRKLYSAYHFTNPITNSLIGIGFGAQESQGEKLVVFDFMKGKILNIYSVLDEDEGGVTWSLLASKGGSLIASYIMGRFIRLWADLDYFLENFMNFMY